MFRNNITLMPLKRVSKTVVALELVECGYSTRLTYTEDKGKKEILLDGSPINIASECFAFSLHYKVEVSDNAFKTAVSHLATLAPEPETPTFFDHATLDNDSAVLVEDKKEEAEDTKSEETYSYEIPDELLEVEEEEVENLDPDYWLTPEHRDEYSKKPMDFKLKVWEIMEERDEAKKKLKANANDFYERATASLDYDDEEEDEEEGDRPRVAVYDPLYNRHFLPD